MYYQSACSLLEVMTNYMKKPQGARTPEAWNTLAEGLAKR